MKPKTQLIIAIVTMALVCGCNAQRKATRESRNGNSPNTENQSNNGNLPEEKTSQAGKNPVQKKKTKVAEKPNDPISLEVQSKLVKSIADCYQKNGVYNKAPSMYQLEEEIPDGRRVIFTQLHDWAKQKRQSPVQRTHFIFAAYKLVIDDDFTEKDRLGFADSLTRLEKNSFVPKDVRCAAMYCLNNLYSFLLSKPFLYSCLSDAALLKHGLKSDIAQIQYATLQAMMASRDHKKTHRPFLDELPTVMKHLRNEENSEIQESAIWAVGNQIHVAESFDPEIEKGIQEELFKIAKSQSENARIVDYVMGKLKLNPEKRINLMFDLLGNRKQVDSKVTCLTTIANIMNDHESLKKKYMKRELEEFGRLLTEDTVFECNRLFVYLESDAHSMNDRLDEIEPKIKDKSKLEQIRLYRRYIRIRE